MAQEAVNAILQAFQSSLRARMERDQYLQSLQERQAEKQQDNEFRDKQLKAQQDQLDITNKAAQAAFDLQKKKYEVAQAAEDLENYTRKGQLRPGVTAIPGVKPETQPPTQTQVPTINQSSPVWGQPQVGVGAVYPGLSDQAQQKPLTLEDLQKNTVINESGLGGTALPLSQTPEVKLAQQVASEAEQRKNRETQFREQADLARAKALREQTFQDQLEVLGRTQKFQDEQRRKAEQATKDIQDSKLANTLKVAQLRATGGLTGFGGRVVTDEDGNSVYVPNDPEPIINNTLEQAENGTATIDQIKKMFPQARTLGMITGAAQERGIKIISDKQVEKLRELEHVSSLTEDLYKLHQLRLKHPLAIQFPLNGPGNEFTTLNEKLGGDLAGVSKWLNSVPRFTNVELGKVKDAILPSADIFHHTGSMEYTKYEKFVKDIQDSFNTILSDVPEKQKNIIRQKMNLNNFPYLGNAIKSPGTPVNQIGGSVQPTETRGGAQPPAQVVPEGRMLVREKVSGRRGHIDPQNFDPQKYERLSK